MKCLKVSVNPEGPRVWVPIRVLRELYSTIRRLRNENEQLQRLIDALVDDIAKAKKDTEALSRFFTGLGGF
jgi:uncharacterized protein YigA (DUF484 family)